MLVNGVRLAPDPSGAMWWPAERILVVADLHLEKAQAFAARRTLLPPYDTRSTLTRLAALMRRYAPKRLVCLGDSFHTIAGPASLHEDDRAALGRLAREAEWLWILGNHDPQIGGGLPGECATVFQYAGLTFRHEPGPDSIAGEVVGHFHPKVTVTVRGRSLTRRCFLTDGRRLVLPAFGAYAGGLDAADAAFAPLFQRACHAWVLGEQRVFPVPVALPTRPVRSA
jgi:DNA ligase-associated metallophosphoesterase